MGYLPSARCRCMSHFVVKAAARRVLLMGLQEDDPEFSVVMGTGRRMAQVPTGRTCSHGQACVAASPG
jgi:hypothetical protein